LRQLRVTVQTFTGPHVDSVDARAKMSSTSTSPPQPALEASMTLTDVKGASLSVVAPVPFHGARP
jgi:hypothetical protein